MTAKVAVEAKVSTQETWTTCVWKRVGEVHQLGSFALLFVFISDKGQLYSQHRDTHISYLIFVTICLYSCFNLHLCYLNTLPMPGLRYDRYQKDVTLSTGELVSQIVPMLIIQINLSHFTKSSQKVDAPYTQSVSITSNNNVQYRPNPYFPTCRDGQRAVK